jgi:nucleotide-binding universal stress UspA family protein
MKRYGKILVAYDGSDSSRNALRQAIRFSRTQKCEVRALAVSPSYEGDLELVGVRKIKEAIRGSAEKMMGEAEAIARAEGASITTGTEDGEPYERIIDAARAEGCELVVMGRRGLRRLERALMGSVTARVIGHSQCDVLVVPRDATLGWKSVLVAVDGSSYGDAALEKAMDLAEAYGGDLSIAYVVDVNEEFYAQAPEMVEKMVRDAKALLDEMKKKAEARGLKAETYVREGDAHRWIIELAAERKADLIVMGSHGRTGLKRLLMGSVAEKVIGLSSVPVLVAKTAEP